MTFILLMDSANAKAFRSLSTWLPLDGATTNPSILAKHSQMKAEDQLKTLAEALRSEQKLHVQVTAMTAGGMIAEAHRIQQAFDRDICIKVPVTQEGMSAIIQLNKEGFSTTATGIFTVQQAVLAAKAGATYVAPYVNRIDSQHGNSTEVISRIRHLYDTYGLPTRIIAASFKNIRQMEEVMLAGAHEATVSPDLLKTLLKHQGTDQAVCGFNKDYQAAFGEGAGMFKNPEGDSKP